MKRHVSLFMMKTVFSAASLVVLVVLEGCGGSGGSPAPLPPVQRNLSQLKIIQAPQGGMYLGQYEWSTGDIATFEQAVGRKATLWSRYWAMDNFDENTGAPVFPVELANQAWNEGQIVLANGHDVIPLSDNPKPGFTIDKLLNGDYDDEIDSLAEQLSAFGKPVFFMVGREPNGIGSGYFGGFGSDGDQSFEWAVANEKGFTEFDPSQFPNSELYADLGDPKICDGVERLASAQRYYHHYLVDIKGLDFLTFEGMGWALIPIEDELNEAIDAGATQHHQDLISSCYDYRHFYPGDDYVDWVSLNFYTVDFLVEAWAHTGISEDFLISTETYLKKLATIMQKVREVAPQKPVLFTELGFPDGLDRDSARAAERVTNSMNVFLDVYPEFAGFSMWSRIPLPETLDPTSLLYWPFETLLHPNTQQGDALKTLIEINPNKFHSCAYLSDGELMPNCTP